MALGDTQVDEEIVHRSGNHGCAPVGVEGQISWLDAVLKEGLPVELLGEILVLPVLQSPASMYRAPCALPFSFASRTWSLPPGG